jgi:hypothetical protein
MRVVSPLLVLTVVAVFVSVPSAATDDVRFRIAHEYGLDGWDQVEELRYTFNVRAGEREVRRSWIWRPKDRGVTFTDELAGGEPFAYSLDDVGDNPPDKLRAIDHRFINDQYWLLFALHVAWDTDAAIDDQSDQPLPIGEGSATKVTVQYPETGGYTPGDAYDIYVGPDDRVLQWVFRKGGQEEPTLATTWEDQRQFGPLLIPTEFNSGDGSFRLWFTGVAVELSGDGDPTGAERGRTPEIR